LGTHTPGADRPPPPGGPGGRHGPGGPPPEQDFTAGSGMDAGASAAAVPAAGVTTLTPAMPAVPAITGPGAHFAFAPGPFEFGELRTHFLWINFVSLGIVVVLAMLAFTLIVRWPIRGLLVAIEDIEHGGIPAAGGLSAPSELRQIGTALHRLARQLRGSTQERELMLAGMSHDLRSPLARIQAAIELRARPEEDWTPVLRDVREIDHIVGQCIDYVRDGQDEPNGQYSLDELARAVVRAPDDGDIALDLAAPQILQLRRQSLMRALRNLINNAAVHGAPPLRIVTRIENQSAVLMVEDHGPGIDPAQWEQLLKPFAQGSRARNPGGAGLGLAIVQRVAALHGGTLEMRAVQGGSPFAIVLRLPIA
ncbi:MAG: ATP-binding protein, partial [Solimonas sp.]